MSALQKLMAEKDILSLSFVGDAVHTLFVREKLMEGSHEKTGALSKKASRFLNAAAQSNAYFRMLPLLSASEQEFAKRARNTNTLHQAKNFTTSEYHHATAYEAVVGLLYLAKDQRLQKVLELSMKEENNEN